MAEAIYVLCGATSLLCAILLLQSWRVRGDRLLLWSFLCFAALAVNNVMLFVDLTLVPHVDLLDWRSLSALVGTSALLAGLIWEAT